MTSAAAVAVPSDRAHIVERLHQALSLKLRETHRAGAVPMLTLAVMSCRASQYQDAATVLRAAAYA